MSEVKPFEALTARQRTRPAEAPAKAGDPGAYPRVRMRRNRTDAWTRRLVAENVVTSDDFIWPIFLREDDAGVADVAAMPGVKRYTVSEAVDAVGHAADLGIPAIALFPQVDDALKTPGCEEAYNPDNLVCRGVRALKAAHPDVGLLCDVALDPFNSDGHDGILRDGRILNDETIDILCRQALVQAEAGCDVIGPSDMMDGRVGAIRAALDDRGLEDVKICSYAAKYASAFYGPFRDAIGSGGALKGDKKTYQLDPANSDEALRETALDITEGADMVMVKPGTPYLDILRRVKDNFAMPTFAYQVSGEYAMIQAAAANGWLDGERAMMESLLGFKRAGADGILTYFAVKAAERLRAG
jgi:porphobilinogen synthase